jgi:hypothetical protein
MAVGFRLSFFCADCQDMPLFTQHCSTAVLLEGKSQVKLSSPLPQPRSTRLTCLTAYLVSFRWPKAPAAPVHIKADSHQINISRRPDIQRADRHTGGARPRGAHVMTNGPYQFCHTSTPTSTSARFRFNKNGDCGLFIGNCRRITYPLAAGRANCQISSCHGPGRRGSAEGPLPGASAHPAGQAPQLGAAGRDSHQDTGTQTNFQLRWPCPTTCSRWPTSELIRRMWRRRGADRSP